MFGEKHDMLLQMEDFLARFMEYLNTDEHRGFKNTKCKEIWSKYDDNLNECIYGNLLICFFFNFSY